MLRIGFDVNDEDVNIVGPGYFALMDIPVVQGREFEPFDPEGAPRVAVVNETMAQQYLQGDALGRTFREEDQNANLRVIGVVRDVRHRFVGSLLIGVGATDPLSFGAAAAFLLLVAAAASYVPARRAQRVDPSVALRTE